MTVKRDPDAILAAWLEEGPIQLPEATRRAIAVNTRTTSQRRRPIWMPRRRPLMNLYARLAIAAIAIVVAVGSAAYFLAPAGGQVGGPPTAAPSPSASTSVTASATPAGTPPVSPFLLAKEGFIYPGRWAPAFDPAFTFTVDREVEHQCAPGFACRGSIDVNQAAWLGLEFGIPAIEANIFRIDKVNDQADPTSLIDPPADLGGWITTLPGITLVAPPKAVTVGGLPATQLDIRGGSKDVTVGPITGVTEFGFGLGANKTARWIVVPVRGHQIVIALDGPEPFATSMGELQPLVDSIVWN
jgi:hypothetical protein